MHICFSNQRLVSIYFTLLLSLSIPVQSIAESIIPTIKTLPVSIQNQICRDLSDDKKDCASDDEIHFIRSVKYDDNQLVLFFFLKDKQERYHRSLTMPVKINAKGQWITGSPFVGEPREVMQGAAKDTRGLWMHAQYNNAGKSPHLLYSKEGLEWTEVDLPIGGKGQKASYLTEEMSKFCFKDNDLYLTLESSGAGDRPISWKSSYAKLLPQKTKSTKAAKLWKIVDTKTLKAITCQYANAKNNAWLIQSGETVTLLLHDTKKLTIKVPHISSVDPTKADTKPAKVKTKPKAENTVKVEAKPAVVVKNAFAVQVGAYNQHAVVADVVSTVQKAGFKTFTKVLDGAKKGNKIKKIYIGPYKNREVATKKLVELKTKFNKDAGMQSAFIVAL